MKLTFVCIVPSVRTPIHHSWSHVAEVAGKSTSFDNRFIFNKHTVILSPNIHN